MDEFRVVTDDRETTVVIRCDPATPIEAVGRSLKQRLGRTETPVIDGMPLVGPAPWSALGLGDASSLEWVGQSDVTSPSAMVLACVAGEDLGTRWALTDSEYFIGRDAECPIAVRDTSVSRRHTRVAVSDATVTVEDLGSTNGTLVNQKRLTEPRVLTNGDRIRVGQTVLELVMLLPDPVVGRAELPAMAPDDGLHLCVIGGSQAGFARRLDHPTLTPGAIDDPPVVVGRSTAAAVVVDDPLLSGQHFAIDLKGPQPIIEDLGSSNGTFIDGVRVHARHAVTPASVIGGGNQLFTIRPTMPADAVLGDPERGRRRYDRVARIRTDAPTPRLTVPTRSAPADKPPFPWAIVIAPLVVSLAVAFVFRRPEALLFSLLSPVMAVSSSVSSRRATARRGARDDATYHAAVADLNVSIRNAVLAETGRRWHEAPDAALIADIAAGPNARLWERRLTDGDALVVRVGTAPRDAAIDLNGLGSTDAPQLPPVPVTVDLAAAGVTSLAGDADAVRHTARWIIGQLAALVSPHDLAIGILTFGGSAEDWSSIGWISHARLGPGNGIRLGNDDQSREGRIAELTTLLDSRQELQREQRIDTFAPLVLTVLDDSRELRRLPGMLRLLDEGPAVGLIFLTLDTDTNRTPGEARALFVIDRDDTVHGRLEVAGAQPVEEILVEGVDPHWLNKVALATASIEPALDDAASQIPASVRFADLANLDVGDQAPLLASWSAGARTVRATVGATAEGPFAIDLSQDGPHAFVAGTTGSGKTELLLTLITSLALGNRPEALNVIVVDWKGGGDFVELGRLPHTVGMVTNLDGHLATRALVSLQAEVARRQGLLKDLKEQGLLSESNIAAAWDEQDTLARAHALARLVIVVDEFAELAQAIPDFLAGLVRIARVGRALGIHLVLATQRPQGVISGDLAANVGLRLVLRTERSESREVLESDHADHISRRQRGRGFVRYGDPPRLVEFQTARVAGRRPGVVTALPDPVVDRVGWRDLGYALPRLPDLDDRPDAETTDLHALVSLTRGVADELGLPDPRSPWLAPLPSSIDLEGLPQADQDLAAPFGMVDDPGAQEQRPFVFDLQRNGHLAVVGSSGSGRTTALRSLAVSLAKRVGPDDVNIYGFDFGSGGLLSLTVLAHVGAIVRSNETDRVARVLERLSDEITRRQGLLADVQAANIGDQRAIDPNNALPHIVVLFDRWDSFAAEYPLDTAVHQIVLRMVRDGLGVGIHLVFTGDRMLLTGRLAGELERKLMLPFADRDDYRDGNLRPTDLPEVIPPGRGFLAEAGLEVQIAILGDDDSGPALRRTIEEHARVAAASQAPPARLIRVEALPVSVAFDDVWARTLGDGPFEFLVGVGGDDLEPQLVELTTDGPGFTVAGPPGTGRSTALVALARSALARGTSVAIITPRPSALESLDGGGVHHLDAAELDPAAFAERVASAPTLLIVDDVHALSADHSATLRAMTDALAGRAFACAIAGDIDKLSLLPLAMGIRQSGSGLLLSPRNLDRDLLSLTALPATIVGRQPPGRGFLARRSTGLEIQVVR